MCFTRILLALGLMITVSGVCIGQTNHLSSTLSKGYDSSPVTVKLSEALKSFKSVFDVDILFEDKLVEGVMVSKDLLNPKESVEINLANLLSAYSLGFKKVKDKTYVIISLKKSNKRSSAEAGLLFQPEVTINSNEIKPDEIPKAPGPGYIIVSGLVKDDKNAPLAGVTIREKGESATVISKADGTFSIKVVSTKDSLVFSYLGFETVTVGINEVKDKLVINLKTTAKDLDQVVVIGYGTQKKRDLTGSIAKVNVADLQKAPVRSFEEALAGRVAGVQVTSADGQPGSTSTIVIRGNNSLTQDNSPLYVVDGFPIENPDNNTVNPADIESIEILKDASATAIYGARAANGVIIITTKKGVAGKTKFSLTSNYGIQMIGNKIPVLNGYQFVKYQYQLDSTDTKTQYLSNGKIVDSYKGQQGIDWQDETFRDASISNTTLSMSGGNPDTKFFISGSALQQDGIVKYSGYNRYQARFRFDHNVDAKTKVSININYSVLKGYGTIPSAQDSSTQTRNLMFSVWGYRPIADSSTKLLSSGVDPFFALDPNDARFNPLLTVEYQLRNRFANNLYGNLAIDHEITKELKFRALVGCTNDLGRNEEFNGTNTVSGSPLTTVGKANGVNGSFLYTTRNSYVSENTLSYNKKIDEKNILDVVTGFTFQGTGSYMYGAAASQLPNESLGLAALDQGSPKTLSTSRTNNTLASFLGRINFNHDTKYLATFSFRADGSSKFSAANKWSYFPSGSFAWRMSQENFMKRIKFLNDVKLRASYGLVGNNRISDFAYLPTLNSTITLAYPFNGSLNSSVVPSTLGNPNLKWETTAQADAGLDVTMYKNLINVTIDIYRKITSNLLLNANISPSSGNTSAYENVGKVQNEGLEIAISANLLSQSKVKWTSSFNVAFNRNKVLALTYGQETLLSTIHWDSKWSSPAYIAKVGQPMGLMYGYIWDGNYQYKDFIKSPNGVYTLKPDVTSNTTIPSSKIQPGFIKYKDLNGDLVMNDNDKTIIGNGNPKFIGGFTNNFIYGRFDLIIFLQFSYGGQILNANRLVFEGNSGRVMQNQYATVLNEWSPQNQNNQMFIAGGYGDKVYSSRVVEDGSYLRIKTLQLGYTIDTKVLKHIGISALKVYVSAQNILTFTKYTGFDPEVSAYPTALTPAFDYSVYPRAKTINGGLNITF